MDSSRIAQIIRVKFGELVNKAALALLRCFKFYFSNLQPAIVFSISMNLLALLEPGPRLYNFS